MKEIKPIRLTVNGHFFNKNCPCYLFKSFKGDINFVVYHLTYGTTPLGFFSTKEDAKRTFPNVVDRSKVCIFG